MLKVTLKGDDGRVVLLLGLSAENLRRLAAAQPITFTGEEVGIPAIREVIVLAAETHEAVARMLAERGLVPAETVDLARRSDAQPGFRYRRSFEQ